MATYPCSYLIINKNLVPLLSYYLSLNICLQYTPLLLAQHKKRYNIMRSKLRSDRKSNEFSPASFAWISKRDQCNSTYISCNITFPSKKQMHWLCVWDCWCVCKRERERKRQLSFTLNSVVLLFACSLFCFAVIYVRLCSRFTKIRGKGETFWTCVGANLHQIVPLQKK